MRIPQWTKPLNEQCFRYEYDSRQRVILKKVPGAGQTELVYDKRDRPIMSRDSSLKVQGYWLINKYDSLNRLVKNALVLNSFTRARQQDSCNNNINYPVISNADVMQENYYDNYLWITATPQLGIQRTLKTTDINSTFFFTVFNQSPEYAQKIAADTLSVHGLVTGSKVRLFGTSTYLYSVNFYDTLGRLIQTQRGNVSNGNDVWTTQYDFSGKPLRVLHSQQKNGTPTRLTRELTKYDYDHAGRVQSVIKKIGPSGTDVTIAANKYNELGQLKTKTLGTNMETQNFEYNVRGWLLGNNRG